MSTEKMREEFEVAFRSSGDFAKMSGPALDSMLERGTDGEYRSVRVHGAWWGWQASHAAIEVDLPSHVCEEEFDDYSMTVGYNLAIDSCANAVESLGLKVKPC